MNVPGIVSVSVSVSVFEFSGFFVIFCLVAEKLLREKDEKCGDAPQVIARGGFSGLFPDSSFDAYEFAIQTSVTDVLVWCDVQLTKDEVGICFPGLTLEKGSGNINYSTNKSVYLVNGVPTSGYFTVDYTVDDLKLNVPLTQVVLSRTEYFDGRLSSVLTVDEMVNFVHPPRLWLNIEHDAFFTQHNLSMKNFLLSVSKKVDIDYISSPEISFLTSIASRFKKPKLVFRLNQATDVEPSTNQTYESLLKNLTFIKTFAEGILVPKTYIWPVDESSYLLPHTSLVLDAHIEGLEVFAADFVNDPPLSYNYSYDPVTEYLYHINNGDFSVDGVLSDFPISASEAVDCFAHLGKNASQQVDLLVISNCGASGDYPSCTDLAYTKAVQDGVDVLDCPVQMSSDGIPFCMSSANLIESTNVAQTFTNISKKTPLGSGTGIYSFSLTWSQIQTLTPSISNPYESFYLYRNPKYKNSGHFMTLSDFLEMTKNTSSLSGVLIGIENAAYLAQQGLGVTKAVEDALMNAGYGNSTALKIMIQSTDSSVLKKFKDRSNYELVYWVDEGIRDATNSTIREIKTFADSIVFGKSSVFSVTRSFTTGATDVVAKLKAFELPVYVETFRNEFASQAWDFYADATVEINSYAIAGISGVITDFPKTSARYKKNRCSNRNNPPSYISPAEPGGLLKLVTPEQMPPAEAPYPILTEADVVEPPLPPVSAKPLPDGAPIAPSPVSAQPEISPPVWLSSLATLFLAMLLL
ncbi:hypothetical protein ACFE04_022552 [Oxalis oulophora]